MLGYCSNSPLRCENARSAKIINGANSCCPNCQLFLIPAQDVSQQLIIDEQILRLAMLVIAIMLSMAIYFYYLSFV